MIDRVIANRKDINILPYQQFNPHKYGDEIMSNDPSIFAKHYGTSVWSI